MRMCTQKQNDGFTLVEVLISIGLLVVVLLLVGSFIGNIFQFEMAFTQQLSAQQEIGNTFAVMVREMHSMTPSALGGYPISQAGTSTITFFSDLNGDGVSEQVRYVLNGATLQKGIVVPTGNPLAYNQSSETITDMIHNVVATSSLFTYYDQQYTGVESPLNYPLTIANIQLIKATISAKDSGQTTALTASIAISPRNLRLNQ